MAMAGIALYVEKNEERKEGRKDGRTDDRVEWKLWKNESGSRYLVVRSLCPFFSAGSLYRNSKFIKTRGTREDWERRGTRTRIR